MNKSLKKAIAGSYIIPLLEYIDCHQILDANALLSSLQIKREQLDSNRYFLSAEQYIGLMVPILEKVDHHDLINFLISGQNISQHGLLGLLSLCSINIRQAINMLIRFYKLRSRLVNIEFFEQKSIAIIRVTPAYDLKDSENFTLEMGLSTLHLAKQQVLNTQNTQDRICLTHSRSTAEHFLGNNIAYNQPYNQLEFPAAELDCKIKTTHKPTFDLLEEQCNTLLDNTESVDITERVRHLIKKSDECFPTLTQASNKLAMSTRTLSRHLKQKGKTYQNILDEERIARAKQLLLDTELSITEVAMYLHFTDASHLTKMFRQHVNQTPMKYRKSMKSG
jgi:AraC-like DNA-binding protein